MEQVSVRRAVCKVAFVRLQFVIGKRLGIRQGVIIHSNEVSQRACHFCRWIVNFCTVRGLLWSEL